MYIEINSGIEEVEFSECVSLVCSLSFFYNCIAPRAKIIMRQPPSIGIHTCRLQKTDYVCTLSVVIWEFALTICERDLGCQVATLTQQQMYLRISLAASGGT